VANLDLMGQSMQNAEYDLRRTRLPGTSVNKPRSCFAFIVGSSRSATMRATKRLVREDMTDPDPSAELERRAEEVNVAYERNTALRTLVVAIPGIGSSLEMPSPKLSEDHIDLRAAGCAVWRKSQDNRDNLRMASRRLPEYRVILPPHRPGICIYPPRARGHACAFRFRNGKCK
jgi:hypothetical protein